MSESWWSMLREASHLRFIATDEEASVGEGRWKMTILAYDIFN